MVSLEFFVDIILPAALRPQAEPDSDQQLYVQQPSTHVKPDGASAILSF
jgi:hypothetical protein